MRQTRKVYRKAYFEEHQYSVNSKSDKPHKTYTVCQEKTDGVKCGNPLTEEETKSGVAICKACWKMFCLESRGLTELVPDKVAGGTFEEMQEQKRNKYRLKYQSRKAREC